MPENPLPQRPLGPAEWVRDLVKEKSVAPHVDNNPVQTVPEKPVEQTVVQTDQVPASGSTETSTQTAPVTPTPTPPPAVK